ncbi:hypothetical protein WME91_07975 [Sorangium sp. So ce269]
MHARPSTRRAAGLAAAAILAAVPRAARADSPPLGGLDDALPVRPSISPELGVHLGSCCRDFAPRVTLILRGDVWFAGDDALPASALAGWSFY